MAEKEKEVEKVKDEVETLRNLVQTLIGKLRRASTATYAVISGNDTTTDVTGAELEELTDGSSTTLHEHPSGLWTPTTVAVANVDATSAHEGRWIRQGDNIFCGIKVDVDPTAGATTTQVRIPLPVASTLTTHSLSGIASDVVVIGVLLADTSNHAAILQFTSGGTTNRTHYCTFSYVVA